jgi:macrolide transport system ATP-binding/permease protein
MFWADRDVLDIAHDTRLLVTGPNGAGKSTLLALLAGHVRPARGTVLIRAGIKVALLTQHISWDRPDRSAFATYAQDRPGDPDDHLSELRSYGLLHPRELQTPIGRLSVGQQRRLALAMMLADRPDVLLLDEPTDHLSLFLVEELEEAVREWQGPVVVASHDRWLRRRWAGQHALLEDGALQRPLA